MKPALLSILVAVSLCSVALAQGGAAAVTSPQVKKSEHLFDPKADPAKDLAAAVKKATKQNKRILLDIGGDWCPWCHKLDQMFKQDKDVAANLKANYIVVKVNFSEENKNEDFLSNYPKITGYPHLFVLDKGGKLLHSQDTGLLETGPKHDHDKVMTFLNKWKT